MDDKQLVQELNLIFRDVFDNEEVEVSASTTANDIDEWDSLTHVLLIVAIEKHFKIRFSSKEIQGWDNVGEMITSIQAKLKNGN